MSLTLLKNVILPAAFNKDTCELVGCELNRESDNQDQFQSNVVFLTATVRNNNSTENIPLVVKFEPFSELMKSELKTNLQFHNEVLMYTKLLPLLDKHSQCEDIFPKFYYGISNTVRPEEDVLLIGDLSPFGFKLTEERCFLNYQHLAIALKKLGRFHALSYSVKQTFPQEFHSLVTCLRETRWSEDVYRPLSVTKACFHRAIDPLIKRGKDVQKLSYILNLIDEDTVKFFGNLLAPNEPAAVLCHGDFCRNNMLFKYDHGVPVDVRFFDIATVRYTSPAVDIALILLMNSTRELRARHWDDLLRVYHEALSTSVPGVVVPSLEAIRAEMRKMTLHGFIHCCYFLPLMLYVDNIDMAKLMESPPEQVARTFVQFGGEEGTRLLSDMAEELLDRDCFNI